MGYRRPRPVRSMSHRGAWITGLVVLGILAGLLGCTGTPVQYDYDAKVNFSAYKTYDWAAETRGPADPGGFDNPIMNGRVRRAVESALAAKGYRREPSAEPDFRVTYYPFREANRSQQVHLGFGFGMGPLGVGLAAPVGDPHRAAIGAIVLQIQDSRTGLLVWKATADGALQGSDDPAEADADVTRAVQDMLKRFPPGI